MSSEEGKPKSVMSRNNSDSKVVSGGRVVKHRRMSSWPTGHRSTWPTHPDESLSPNGRPMNKRQKRKRVPAGQTGLPPESEAGEKPADNAYEKAYDRKMKSIRGHRP